ncbi:Hypothetical Protein FCC1311_016012 [Hondaea fermentalgiana]|uniref:Peroxisomal membrane protein 11C n=1 Tax=Hondaea fermentalgiana TaxID=2315210 RepID=A0A2R5GA21_9STRA|nr:Hypothetical Protein FCC1311_016012 [Hondaea fermentalgiana]|eukprot:GBG25383.1 Hypothetical Protein FCC1311_016012 [Hondaea fermentalgiana]
MASGPSFDLSLAGANKFLATSVGRDKVGKFVHYGARAVAGLAAQSMENLPKDSPEYAKVALVHQRARSLFVRIMDSRRTNRWLSSLGIILALRKAKYPWREDATAAYVVAQLGMIWWHVGDHIRWLQQIGWVPGDQARSKRISFTGFVVSAVLNVAYLLSEIQLEGKQVSAKEDEEAVKKQKFHRRLNLVKHLVTVVSTLHISELFMSSEPICGACGALASAIDIYLTFPRLAEKKE